jgi:hypothetical protein
MAKYDQRCFVRELVQAMEMGGNRVHRNQFGAFDLSDLVLIGTPDVDQDQPLSGIEPLFHFPRRNFERYDGQGPILTRRITRNERKE